jgi:hypothetical protein
MNRGLLQGFFGCCADLRIRIERGIQAVDQPHLTSIDGRSSICHPISPERRMSGKELYSCPRTLHMKQDRCPFNSQYTTIYLMSEHLEHNIKVTSLKVKTLLPCFQTKYTKLHDHTTGEAARSRV